MKKFPLLLLSTLIVGSFSGAAMAEKKMLLKTPIYYNSVLPGLGSTIKYVSDNIQTLSGNTLKMKIYEPKKLVSPKEILDAVSTGKVQAGYATAGNWGGKIPAARLFSAVPFGPEASEYLAWFYHGNGNKLHQELYDNNNLNVKVQVCGVLAPETSGWFKDEINKPEDLDGLKMRFFGLGALVMEKLGVSTVGLPGGEIFPAIEKGVIDATEFSMPVVDQRIGLKKLLKYNYFPGWHQQATIMELIQAPVMQQNVEDGVVNKYWSPEMLTTFKAKWDEVVVEQSAADPAFKKIHDDLAKFRKTYDLWESNAFLPRPKPSL
jgi:TRAP-type mannitol/chloroaromatic compound transport system substrate-binding protein